MSHWAYKLNNSIAKIIIFERKPEKSFSQKKKLILCLPPNILQKILSDINRWSIILAQSNLIFLQRVSIMATRAVLFNFKESQAT